MQDHFSDKIIEPSFTQKEEDKNLQYIKSLQDTYKQYRKDKASLKKSLDMTSTLQGKEFYEKLLKMDKSEKPVKEYEIEVPNLDALNLNEFQKNAAKKGVHIYGIKTESFLNDKDRKVIFKMRENDQNDFDKIKTDLEDAGLKVKPHKTNTLKKKYNMN